MDTIILYLAANGESQTSHYVDVKTNKFHFKGTVNYLPRSVLLTFSEAATTSFSWPLNLNLCSCPLPLHTISTPSKPISMCELK